MHSKQTQACKTRFGGRSGNRIAGQRRRTPRLSAVVCVDAPRTCPQTTGELSMHAERGRDAPHFCQRQPTPAEKALVARFERRYLRDIHGHGVRGLRVPAIRFKLQRRLEASLLGCAHEHIEPAPEWQDFEALVGATSAAFTIYAASKGVRLP